MVSIERIWMWTEWAGSMKFNIEVYRLRRRDAAGDSYQFIARAQKIAIGIIWKNQIELISNFLTLGYPGAPKRPMVRVADTEPIV